MHYAIFVKHVGCFTRTADSHSGEQSKLFKLFENGREVLRVKQEHLIGWSIMDDEQVEAMQQQQQPDQEHVH